MTEVKATNVHWHDGEVSREDRNALLKQKGATLWFTGLSGSGKSTVAVALEKALMQQGHLCYRLDGDNIRMDLPITLDEALNGAKVKCPTVDGAVMLTIKPGTNGGTVMRLKGKGWSKKDGNRGDQLVTLEIQMPQDTAELAKRLEGWQDTGNPRAKLGV